MNSIFLDALSKLRINISKKIPFFKDTDKRIFKLQKNVLNSWNNKTYGKKNFYLVLSYSIVFFLMCSVVFLQFKFNGRSFIWGVDGVRIEIPARTYLVQYVKKIFDAISNNRSIPVYDFNLINGTDSLQFLAVWYLEPINFLGLLFPAGAYSEFFLFLIIAHLYLSGLSFIYYSRYMHNRAYATFLSSFVYIFCGYALNFAVKHPVFISPFIYLPLLLTGVEKIISKKQFKLFIISIFLTAWTSYFFFFQFVIIVFLYAVIRVIFLKRYRIGEIFILFIKTLSASVLGLMMALLSFVPALMGYINSNRISAYPGRDNMLRYSLKWYIKLPFYMFMPKMLDYLLYFGFPALALFAIVYFIKKKGHITAKIFTCLSLLSLLIPAINYATNAFSNLVFRIAYIYALNIAMIIAMCFDQVMHAKIKNKYRILTLLIFILIGGNMVKGIRGSVFSFSMLLAIMLYICLFVLDIPSRYKYLIATCSVLMTIAFNSYWMYCTTPGVGVNLVWEYPYEGHFEDRDWLYSKLSLSAAEIEDESYYRVARSDIAFKRGTVNSEVMLGISTNAVHYNTMDKNIYDFYYDMELETLNENIACEDLNERADLLSLLGTKYYMAYDYEKSVIPYGFKPVGTDGDIVTYENENWLPLGYTYERSINQDDYNKLSSLQKQAVLLDAVLLETDSADNKQILSKDEEEKSTDRIHKCNCTISGMNNIDYISEGNYYVRNGSTMTFSVESMPECETYIHLSGVNIDNNPENIEGYFGCLYFFTAYDENGNHVEFTKESNTYRYTSMTPSMLINLGYNEKPLRTCTIRFASEGNIKIQDIKCYCEEMTPLEEKTGKLSEETLQNTVLSENQIEGDITVSSDKYLFFYLPYSDSWHAYVDGKETKVIRANKAYMALPLESGNHHVVMKYIPIFMNYAVILTAVAWLIFAGLIIIGIVIKIKKKSTKKNMHTESKKL